MATANVVNDLEHFVNCGVCFCEFDEEIRKPKFLQCAHTFCLKCLQEICRAGLITCPICRKTFFSDTASLPNNSYALQMVKLKEEREKPKIPGGSSLECRACGSVGNAGMIEQTKKLAAVFKKRKAVQVQLDLIVKSITALGNQVKKLQEENDTEMAELISLIEHTDFASVPAKSSPLILLPPSILSNNTRFVLGPNSVFILRLFQPIVLIGEIRIRPALTFHPEFLRKLGEFCYKSPTQFSTTVKKAMPGVFVLMSMSHVLFRPTFAAANPTTRITASKMGEVGIILKKNGGVPFGTVTDWDFFIPINPTSIRQKKIISPAAAELFGHIIDASNSPNAAVKELSKSQKSERGRYLMTLESQ